MLFAGRDGGECRVEIVPKRVGTLAITEGARHRLMRDKMLTELQKLGYSDTQISRAFKIDRRHIARRTEEFQKFMERVRRAE